MNTGVGQEILDQAYGTVSPKRWDLGFEEEPSLK